MVPVVPSHKGNSSSSSVTTAKAPLCLTKYVKDPKHSYEVCSKSRLNLLSNNLLYKDNEAVTDEQVIWMNHYC